MNRVEQVLRENGTWNTPITVDARGHATFGGQHWGARMYAEWIDAGYQEYLDEDESILKPGGPSGHCWADDQYGRHWWVSDTLDWDRAWFKRRGVKPPRLMADYKHTYWHDHGGGLSNLRYRAPDKKPWWRFW